jgi:hypothetical protein
MPDPGLPDPLSSSSSVPSAVPLAGSEVGLAGLQLFILPAGVLVERAGRAVVEVDVSAHRVAVRARGHEVETEPVTAIGLLNAAWTMASVLRRVAAGTGRAPVHRAAPPPPVQGQLFATTPSVSGLPVDDRDTLIERLKLLLLERCIAAARRREPRIDEAAAIVGAVRGHGPPPIMYSEGVLLAPHLIDDIFRFRAAAVVVAMLEPAHGRMAASIHGQAAPLLSSWRSLLAPNKVVSRALSKTLAAVDEPAFAGVPSSHIWALRRIHLIAPVKSPGILAALAERSQVGGGTQDRDLRLLQLVDEATIDGLRDEVVPPFRLQQAPKAQQLHTLCTLLARCRQEAAGAEGLPPALRLRRLVRSGLAEFEEAFRQRRANRAAYGRQPWLAGATSKGATAATPPIPLPNDPGIRLLVTADDYLNEGKRMHHCVAMHFSLGRRGLAYIFHVDDGPTTVHINPHGVLVEARGEANVRNDATRRAGRRLAAWAAPLRLLSLGHPTMPVWLGVGPALPSGTQPLRILRDVVGALAATMARRSATAIEADADAEVQRFRPAVVAAQQGRAWLGVDAAGDVVVIAAEGTPP